jgi:hypothetical protein
MSDKEKRLLEEIEIGAGTRAFGGGSETPGCRAAGCVYGQFVASIRDLSDLAGYGDTNKRAVAQVTELAWITVRATVESGQPNVIRCLYALAGALPEPGDVLPPKALPMV